MKGAEDHAVGERRILVGVITGARGLRGQVWLKTFVSEETALASYGTLTDEAGERSFEVRVVGVVKGRVAAVIAGVNDRDAAEALIGTSLFASRQALPPVGEDEYYHADLVGLPVYRKDREGVEEVLGRVKAIQDFGAGPLLDVEGGPVGAVMVPFTRAFVLVVDLACGRIEVVLHPGLLPDHLPVQR